MIREIEKLGLTQKQYSTLGTIMMVFCLILSGGVFFLADVSLAVGIVLAVVAVEFGFVGYCFRRVSGLLSSCEDCDVIARHKNSDKSRRNTATVSLFSALIFLLCVLCVIIVADFKPANALKTADTTTSAQTSAQNQQASLEDDEENEEMPLSSQPEIVFVTNSGKRFHYSQECAGKNSFAVTIQEALDHSLTPCRNCASE